ncbi:hypothetical protein EB796_001583 [Bugula neritina]|uniref:G-protein coupled receptors family 1 profile domain-containing protein n=1 Tax=Bugula neritina TaxID=10212 RepID=A0A7J7KPJ8_BUGNE|nr:hypothetical protein EB796_001583 [Bugula neritina]
MMPQTEACTKADTEFICGFIEGSLQNFQDTNGIDFTNLSESGWIWASLAVYMPLCIFGILGNILTIVMFSKYIKKTTTSVFILALAAVDLSVCSISMPIWLFTTFTEDHGSELLCKADKFINFFSIPMSAGILLTIAIDRFLLVFFVKAKIITRYKAKLIIFFLALGCIAIAIPQTLSFTTLYKLDEELVAAICQGTITCNTLKCQHTSEYVSRDVWFYMWRSLIIAFLVMSVIFTSVYTSIFAKVYRIHRKMSRYTNSVHEKRREMPMQTDHVTFSSSEPSSDNKSISNRNSVLGTNNNRPKKQNLPHLQTARILFLVTFCFIVAYAPLVLMMFLGSCESKEEGNLETPCRRNDYRRFLWHFYFLHHIVNPIIYSFMNPRFRDALRKCASSNVCCKNGGGS